MSNDKNLTVDETFNLAVQSHQNNNLQDAQNYYQKILKIDPNYVNANYNLGVIFKDSGEYQKAKDCYEKVIEIVPNHVDAYNNLGVIFKELGEYQKAIGFYEKAIEIDPNYANAHNNLGVIFKELGEYQKAISFYEKAIDIDPNHANTHNNLGVIYSDLGEYQKAKSYFKKSVAINSNDFEALGNIADIYVSQLTDFEIAISKSNEALKVYHKNSTFINQTVSLFRLKHDVEQANYISSKDYKLEGIKEFQKIGSEILDREENKENEDNYNKKILLTSKEINSLLPFYKSDHIYKPKKIYGSCINSNKNWSDVEEEYLNSDNQIMYIDDFLSDEALIELREFCLVSKVWYREYNNKYLGAFSDSGFISPIHLQIAIELKQKLPKLFGPHILGKFWGFKYDSKLGRGINIHADFAIHNLNFWITPDEYNNNKNSGGLKVYDAPAPDHWTYRDYNMDTVKIYKFLEDNSANCTNVPYKFNRAVLFNSAYFHETDEIDFKDEYVGRRINNTYLFGKRLVKSSLD